MSTQSMKDAHEVVRSAREALAAVDAEFQKRGSATIAETLAVVQAGMVLVAVEVSLEAVEQQRIANLISLMQMQAEIDDKTDVLAAEAMHALVEYVQIPATQYSGQDEYPVIRPEIREALGLM